MFKKTLICILFFLIIFLSLPFKSYAFFEGIGANFSEIGSSGSKNWKIFISNTEEKYSRGQEINVSFVIYQCRKAEISDALGTHWCAGNSEDYINGSREDLNFSTALPGREEGELVIEKTFSKSFSCGRIQVDLAPNPQVNPPAIYGGEEFSFGADCAAPTAPPTPTPTITPTPTVVCTDRRYTQCGDVVCNGITVDHKNIISVVEKTCGSSKTYTCTNLGPLPGQCDNPGPTPTPTRPAPPTSTPTQTPSGVPTATATSAAPTANPTTLTPTPGFSNAMCKCDGITTSGIFQGQNAVVNTFAKVEGNDITAARVTSMTYNFGVATARNPNLVTPLISPVPIAPVIVENTSSKVRYQTTFRFLVPTPPANNPLYRVWVNINCARKTAQSTSPSQVVLSASTKKDGGLLNNIRDAFLSASSTIQTKIKEVLGITNTPPSLQLAPIYPAQISREYCSSFWYQFQNPQ